MKTKDLAQIGLVRIYRTGPGRILFSKVPDAVLEFLAGKSLQLIKLKGACWRISPTLKYEPRGVHIQVVKSLIDFGESSTDDLEIKDFGPTKAEYRITRKSVIVRMTGIPTAPKETNATKSKLPPRDDPDSLFKMVDEKVIESGKYMFLGILVKE